MADKNWLGKTGGTQRMQRTLIRWFRYIDTRLIYPFMALWVLGYILALRRERRASWHYWRRRQGKKLLAACLWLWRQYYTMGKVVLDRFAAFAGQRFDIRTDDPDNLMDRLQQAPEGFIVVSSHIGNQEMAGYFTRSRKPMHLLSYMGDTQTMNEQRARMFGQKNLFFLPMQPDGSHVFEMHDVLSRGEALSIHGDRTFSDSRTLLLPFLGAEAVFPEGPFRVAAAERVPVVTMFVLRTGHNRYELRIRGLSRPDDSALNNRQLARALAERYAAEMEAVLSDCPEQWFNFYEFWKE
ncbi:MAG: hypothetical protein J5635_05670 [Paludibacteraceae bacterium]|nr:hypothetical protein [Paludibacteraceae bacterium]